MQLLHRRLHFRNFDPSVTDFVAATGASDTAGINQLMTYIRGEGLFNDVRLFPFKPAQNIGSGTTVYGLGGWTSNNIALVNGPTWGSSGVTFDAVNDVATLTATGIRSLATMHTFDVQKPTGESLADTLRFGGLSYGDISLLPALRTGFTTSIVNGETISAGLTVQGPTYRVMASSSLTWAANEKVQYVTCFSNSAPNLWKGKIASVNLTSGTQSFAPSECAGWTNDETLKINGYTGSGQYFGFTATTRVALLICKTALTTTQRETITDLLDAL